MAKSKELMQLADWRDAGHELYPVSINYSSNQLSDMGYVDFVEELLYQYDIIQGFYFSKPLPAEEAIRFLPSIT
ncbi:MAG: hypothetical protein K5857_06585 [Lachnospiraceae bacterium]|nr:hypothetical protein [Lachnospiraceae bacterium]